MESSFQIAVCGCPDINASTLAVDITGRYAVVSGRKSTVLIDLDGNEQGTLDTSKAVVDNNVIDANAGSGEQTSPPPSPRGSTPVNKRMSRNSKYEPTASQFNRYMNDLFALTSYQVVEVFSIEDLNPTKPKLLLKGHSRAIADLEWSHFDPYLLGSSAADCLTNLWDIRDSRRPTASLTSVSGATLVRFSKISSNLIATSHEIDVRIWDIRQPNLPLYYIAAHLQKINGMDWNPSKNNCDQEQLITCSQDNTIKLWDLNANKIRPSANLQTRMPAWRIRYTPISSNAILTSTLPQLRSRTECLSLKLWSMKPDRCDQKKLELILGLVGHSDVIVDFDWRSRPSNSNCEIVSWSKDQTLRVWRVDNQFIEMNVDNSDFEAELHENACESLETSSYLNDTCKSGDTAKSRPESNPGTPTSPIDPDSPVRSPRLAAEEGEHETSADKSDDQENDVEAIPASANELWQEFNLMNKNIPNIEFEELNPLRRVCLVTARAKTISCRLRIALPPTYPHNDCPTFTIVDSNQYGTESLCKEAGEKLLNLLNETAKSQLSRSRNCIEPCLRKFIAALLKITSHSSYRKRATGNSNSDYKDDPITLSAQRDHSVPFPHTSGVKFCGNLLVCFGRPMIPTVNTSTASGGGDSANWLVETPRSMAQLSAQLDNMRRQGSYNLSNISISYFYYGAMRRAELQNRSAGGSTPSTGSASKGYSSGSRTGSKYTQGRAKSAQSILSKSFKSGPVIVYDVSSLLGGLSRELAENYVFDKDVIKMCRKNAEIAAQYNRRDLVQIWSLAELSSEGVINSYLPNKDDDHAFSLVNHDSDFGDRPWTMHPFGSKLIQSLIDHYVYNCHDVQTAAMLVWTFSSPKLGRSVRLQSAKSVSAGFPSSSSSSATAVYNPRNNTALYNIMSNYHTVIPGMLNSNRKNVNSSISQNVTDSISGEWSFVNGPETHLYSNSWSNSTIHEHLTHDSLKNNSKPNANGEISSGTGAVTASGQTDNDSSVTTATADDLLVGARSGNAKSNHSTSLGNDTNGDKNRCGDSNSKFDDRFPRLNILSPERSLQNDLIMHIYAELLYRLNLLNQRAMVLKNVGSNSAYSEIFGDNKQNSNHLPEERLANVTIQCYNHKCRTKCHSVQCFECKKYSLYCSICRLPVKGSCSICLKCLHGGHVNHFKTWFSSYDFCPTGCGCKCLSSEC